MLNLRRRVARMSSVAALLSAGLVASGCLEAPAPDLSYDRLDLSGEVFRIFCRRIARGANPDDSTGDRFYPICDGKGPPRSDDDPRLVALVEKRALVIETLDKVFGEAGGEGIETFKEGELTGFLRSMVPFYDPPEQYVPGATRGIADVLVRLVDPQDARAVKVLETVARLSARNGYRTPDTVLGAVRALLTYPDLDTLSEKLLAVVGEGGAAHDAFVHVLESAALELGDEPVAVADRDDTTLHMALELLLSPDARFAGTSGPVLVVRRDDQGNALPTAAAGDATDMATPFPVAERSDDATRDGALSGLAMSSEGQPLYDTFDASRTLLASLMRQTATLIGRNGEERSALEYAAHGLKPLLGAWKEGRTATIGAADYAFTGPDIDDSPLLDLAHAASVLARYPESERMLRLLTQLIEKNESEGMAAVYAALRIDEIADEFPDAKLIGPEGEGSQHEMWDDIIAAGQRIAKRPGMVEALVKSFTDARSASTGKLLAHWMRHRDEVSYPKSPSTNAADINGLVSVKLSDPVQRTATATGMNRSIWQRTLSMIHVSNGLRICNKENAILKVQTNGLGELTFPATGGYKACDLIEIPDALENYMRALIGKGNISIKDEGAKMLAVLGETLGITGSVGQIQEKESQITGFSDKPTPQSLARFLFAPRNKFLSDMFVPTPIREGVPVNEYEPNALFAVENLDPDVTLAGKPQSFVTLGAPLVEAFDANELRDGEKLRDGYAFGHLMSALHRHWSQPSDEDCPAQVEEGREGCTQRLDPSAGFYAPQTNAVSYEELIARAFDDEDLVGILQRATVALSKISIDGEDGVTILGKFARVMLSEDPALRLRDGRSYTHTNLCVVTTDASGAPSCQGGVGRIVPVLTPIHMLTDALHRFDLAFADDAERLEAWHAGRSLLVDELLAVDRSGSDGAYAYQLRDRGARDITLKLLPWLADRIAAHRTAGDLVAWSDELAPRLAKVLGHPLSAAVVDLLDKFWGEPDASGAFTEVSAYLMDEAQNPEAFKGLLIAAADTLTLLDRDPELSPAIQFAALALAPNAFEALDGKAQPDGKGSATYAALQLTRKLVEADKGTPSTLSKLLRNLVRADDGARAPLEVLIDVVADVNRTEVAQPTEVSLSADENRAVFEQVQGFLADGDRGLERLYKVIQGRKAD
ncbi:MAG: hypothetical protein ABW252_07705 [Polyangiales bacterium]